MDEWYRKVSTAMHEAQARVDTVARRIRELKAGPGPGPGDVVSGAELIELERVLPALQAEAEAATERFCCAVTEASKKGGGE